MKKILFIVGSHRKQSFNHQLAQQIIPLIQHRAETSIGVTWPQTHSVDFSLLQSSLHQIQHKYKDVCRNVKKILFRFILFSHFKPLLWAVSPF